VIPIGPIFRVTLEEKTYRLSINLGENYKPTVAHNPEEGRPKLHREG